jgi:hypothetical protein
VKRTNNFCRGNASCLPRIDSGYPRGAPLPKNHPPIQQRRYLIPIKYSSLPRYITKLADVWAKTVELDLMIFASRSNPVILDIADLA